jgi:hypothetical protein
MKSIPKENHEYNTQLAIDYSISYIEKHLKL